MNTYNFSEIEKRWRETWEKEQVFKVTEKPGVPKYYVLDMFPYPSGAGLHVGHPLGYIASDIVARFKRLQGYNVLHPMGFDAFGLPAEQYAIETGQHPAVTTDKNIERYKEQLKNIGFCYDWSREVKTSDPQYYRWTQWIFLKLYNSWYNPETNRAEPIDSLISKLESGAINNQFGQPWNTLSAIQQQEELTAHRLAYKDVSYINWCETLGTVLANDEVVNGVSERGGYPVERKLMSQWFLRITKYADRLLQGLDTVDFPESLKEMQKNWIGRSEGALVRFNIKDSDQNLQVFTTRPDTIFGVSFMVMAPEHPLAVELVTPDQKTDVEAYVRYCKSRSELERKAETKEITGVFTGAYAVHPFTGSPIPVYLAEYVLMGYGTGAIMGVPCGDARDHAFAKKFGLEIPNIFKDTEVSEKAYEEKSGILANSASGKLSLSGLTIAEAASRVISVLEQDKTGSRQVNYRMRDAGFSRQRYWGEPFPVVYKDGITLAESEGVLPVQLPEVSSYKPSGDGKSPLATIKQWVELPGGLLRETDTMPGYAGSSWYYLRYMDPTNSGEFCARSKSDYWQQVDLYIGGAEHAVGHLLYSRMWCKVLYDLGYIGFDEPYRKLVNQGMIGGVVYYCYYDPAAKKIYSYSLTPDPQKEGLQAFQIPNEYVGDDEHMDASERERFCVEYPQFKEYEFVTDKGKFTFEKAITKMSKRLRNVVNPDEVIETYGADAFRMYEMFLGPIDQDKPWNTKGIDGVSRFLKRLWGFCTDDEGNCSFTDEPPSEQALKIIHRTLKKNAEDIEKLSFNTCVSSFMICLNSLQDLKCRSREVMEKFLVMLSPFAPHISQEIWHRAGKTGFVLDQPYPEVLEQYLKDDTFNYPVSINGKTRLFMEFDQEAGQDEIEPRVMADPIVQKWVEGKPVRKFILVKGRIVNVVV